MEELSLLLLELGENAFAAGAKNLAIEVCEDFARNTLTFSLQDDGNGLTASVLAAAFSQGFTTRPSNTGGNGLSCFANTAKRFGGEAFLFSLPQGALALGVFPLDKKKRPPLGNIEGTLALLAERGMAISYRHEIALEGKPWIVSLCLTGLKECLPDALRQTAGLSAALAENGSVA